MRLILATLSLLLSFSAFAIIECPGPRCPKSYMCINAASARQYGITCSAADVAASRAAAAKPAAVVDRRTPTECPGKDCPKSYMCIMPEQAKRYGVICSRADIEASRGSSSRNSARRAGQDDSTLRRNPKADMIDGSSPTHNAAGAVGN